MVNEIKSYKILYLQTGGTDPKTSRQKSAYTNLYYNPNLLKIIGHKGKVN